MWTESRFLAGVLDVLFVSGHSVVCFFGYRRCWVSRKFFAVCALAATRRKKLVALRGERSRNICKNRWQSSVSLLLYDRRETAYAWRFAHRSVAGNRFLRRPWGRVYVMGGFDGPDPEHDTHSPPVETPRSVTVTHWKAGMLVNSNTANRSTTALGRLPSGTIFAPVQARLAAAAAYFRRTIRNRLSVIGHCL